MKLLKVYKEEMKSNRAKSTKKTSELIETLNYLQQGQRELLQIQEILQKKQDKWQADGLKSLLERLQELPLERIMEKLDAFSPATKIENNNHLINLIMKKDYQKVNVILNVEGLEFDKDGKVTLTEDQVKVLNEKLDALEKDASDKQTQVEELTTQVENLKKADGDETKKTEGEENGEFEDIFKEANDLYNSL